MGGKYPMASRTSPGDPSEDVCVHCRRLIGVGAWDRWNGFLVECPYCHGFHGRRWRVKLIIAVSFVLNALSFFFTMRPLRALLAIVGWIGISFALLFIGGDVHNEIIENACWIAVFFGPLVINAALLIRNQVDLDREPPTVHAPFALRPDAR